MKKGIFLFVLNVLIVISGKAQKQNQAILDDYPVKDKMFYNTSEITIGTTVSYSNWFTNDLLEETLVFELYTDNHRLLTYHFLNEEVTESFILQIPLHLGAEYDKLDKEKEILTHFSKYITKAKRISQLYFRSQKGFKLGDSIEKALQKYGKPTKILKEGEIQIYHWKMPAYSYVKMYVKKGQIIGIIICREMI